MSRYLAGIFTLLLAVPAMAEGPSYNFVQAGYQSVDLDVGGGFDVDGDGWGVGGSVEFGESFFGFAAYSDIGFDFSVDLSQLQVGVGWHTGISDSTDFVARAGYVEAEVDAPGFGSFDDSGYLVAIGVRSNITPLIELFGEVAYVDFGDDDNTSVGGGVYFNLTETFAIGVGASTDDDATAYGANLRLYFGG